MTVEIARLAPARSFDHLQCAHSQFHSQIWRTEISLSDYVQNFIQLNHVDHFVESFTVLQTIVINWG